MEAIRSFIALQDRGTNVRTQIRAGVATFLTMAYIILVLGGANFPVIVFN